MLGLCDLHCPECYPQGKGSGFIAGGAVVEGNVFRGKCNHCLNRYTWEVVGGETKLVSKEPFPPDPRTHLITSPIMQYVLTDPIKDGDCRGVYWWDDEEYQPKIEVRVLS